MTEVLLAEPLLLKTTPRSKPRFSHRDVLFCALSVVLFLLSGYAFAHRQTLWLDETTQLSGLTLGPVGVTRWLVGIPLTPEQDFGIPTAPDRMPPVSYYVGQLWVLIFGFSELSLRYFGLACVAGAIVLLYDAARRAFNSWAALAAGLYLALSPAILERAVEIRAYPLYLCMAALVTWAVVGYLQVLSPMLGEKTSPRHLWFWRGTLTVGLILMLYTHFIGLLGAGAVLAALFFVQWRRGYPQREIVIMGLLVALAATGLYPFVTASVEVSKHGMQWPLQDRLIGLSELFWYFMSHRLASFDYWLPPLVVGCCLGWLIPLIKHHLEDETQEAIREVMLWTLSLGLLAVTVGTFGARSFKFGQYQYNLWMVPLFGLLFAAAVYRVTVSRTTFVGWRRWLGAGVVLLFLASNAWTTGRIAFGSLETNNIAHGPDPKIGEVIAQLGAANVTVFHDEGSDQQAVQTYYPLSYLFHGKVVQYTYLMGYMNVPTPSMAKGVDFVMFDNWTIHLNPAQTPTRYALVLRSVPLEPRDFMGKAMLPFAGGPAVQALRRAGWKEGPQRPWNYRGMMRQDSWVFERP